MKKAYSVKYKMDEKNGILIRTIFGEINMREIIELWEYDITNNRVTSDLKAVISDFSKGKNLSKIEDSKSIAAFYRKNAQLFKNIKIAVVLTDQSIVIPLLFEFQNKDMKHAAFSTLDAALKWAKA